MRPQRSRSRHRRAAWLSAAVAAAPLALLVVASPTARADGPDFDAHANVDGVLITATNPSLPLGLVVTAAGPTATAHLDSLGDSEAMAAFPYPGEQVVALPGEESGIYGVPLPSYPLIAATAYGDKPKDISYGLATLHAESATGLATGKAVTGLSNSGGTGTARVESDAYGGVTATADSTFNALDLGGLLTLTGVQSHAETTVDAGGNRANVTSLSIGGISAPGLSIVIPKTTPTNGTLPNPIPGLPQLPATKLPGIPLPFGGQTIPAPHIGFDNGAFTIQLPIPGQPATTFAVPAQAVSDAFAGIGVTLGYEPAATTATGATSPSLTFHYDVPSPPANQYFSGSTPVTETVGHAETSVTLHPAAGSLGGLTGGVGATGATSGTVAAGDTPPPAAATGTSNGASVPAALGGGAFDSGSLPSGISEGTASEAAAPALADAPAGQSGAPSTALAAVRGPIGDISNLYLLTVGATVLVLVVAGVLRTLGVRFRWDS